MLGSLLGVCLGMPLLSLRLVLDVSLVKLYGSLMQEDCGCDLSSFVHALWLNLCFVLAQNTSLTCYLFFMQAFVDLPIPPCRCACLQTIFSISDMLFATIPLGLYFRG